MTRILRNALVAITCGVIVGTTAVACARVGTGGVNRAQSDGSDGPLTASTRSSAAPAPSRTSEDTGEAAVPARRTTEPTAASARAQEAPAPGAERGVASWYGEQHHGKQTASGEPFDMYAMTAAHPTLDMGTRVEVENLSNGKTVIVRINDRGPFTGGRIIDVSLAAAQQLGFASEGTAEVEVRLLN